MKAQVTCKICEQEYDFDNVIFLGNFDYEDQKEYPVNICKTCASLIPTTLRLAKEFETL